MTWHDASIVLPMAASLFIVILAQSAATSRAYAVKYGERFNENTDLVGLGFANLAAGFSSTFVVNGSPTKTEMVDEAKSHTQVAQLTTAAVVAVVLLFLTKPLQYLPNAVLSSVVFLIGLKLIDLRGMREILRLRKDEFVVALVTALVVIGVGVEQGIILAIVLSLVLHVRRHYAPVDVVLTWDDRGGVKAQVPHPGVMSEPGLVVYRFGAGIFFANAQRLSDEILELASGDSPPRGSSSTARASTTSTSAAGRRSVSSGQLQRRGVVLGMADLRDSVRAGLDRYGVTAKVGETRFFATARAAVEAFRADRGPDPGQR